MSARRSTTLRQGAVAEPAALPDRLGGLERLLDLGSDPGGDHPGGA
jgi:hypothetical protein